MDILSHIYELLKDQKNVSLFGFGTFCKIKSPGHYDFEKQIFLPPTYNLRFISSYVDDGLLATYVAQQRNISIETVNYFINKFVENLNLLAEQQQQIDLLPLGRMVKKNGEFIFVQTSDLDLGNEFFGLPSFKTHFSQVQFDNKENTLEAQELPAVVDPIKVNLLPKEQGLNALENRKHNILTWVIVVFVLLATSVTIYNFYDVEFKAQKIALELEKKQLKDSLYRDSILKYSILKDTTFQDTLQKEEVKSDSVSQTNILVENEKLRQDSIKKTVSIPIKKNQKYSYELIVIASKTQKVAQEHVDNYKKLGYSAKIIEGSTPQTFKKISIATFSSQEAAKKALPAIQIKLNNKSIYVYQNIIK
ncbi:MAG: hypothetical protein K2Q03_03150 [Sphingobacteriaceae bacterium]|nr:hypothetical protein [Sphingobacteriaceae bacterium]